MSISELTLSSEQGLAIFAAFAGAAFLLLGRRSASRGMLVTISAFVAVAAVLAGGQLIHLKPTHALISDSESTARQSVVGPGSDTAGETADVTSSDPTNGTGSVAGAEQDEQQGSASDDVDSTKGDAHGQTGSSSVPEPPVATPTQPDPSPVQESSGTDTDPAPGE
jgi:hypothetical protein